MFGYFSNVFDDMNCRPLGWHIYINNGIGLLSGVSDAYSVNQPVIFTSVNLGLDFKLYGQDSDDPKERKSALALSFDLSNDVGKANLTLRYSPSYKGAFWVKGRLMPKVGLSYYW